MNANKIFRLLRKQNLVTKDELRALAGEIKEGKLPFYQSAELSADYLDLLRVTEEYRVG